MAKLTVKNAAPDYFWDIFSENASFTAEAMGDGSSVTLTFSGAPGDGTQQLVIKGNALSITSDGKLSGKVTGVTSLGTGGAVLVDVTGATLNAKNLDLHNRWDFRVKLFDGNDKFTGSSHSDDIYSGAGNDRVAGGGGDDFITDFLGNDTYIGGSGYDCVNYSEGFYNKDYRGKGVTVDLGKGFAIDPWGFRDKLVSIEEVRGTNFADKITGSNKVIEEYFEGLKGADVIDGKGGEDMVSYRSDARYGGKRGVTVDLEKGFAVDGFGTRDTLLNIEDARGTAKKDLLMGSAGTNFLRGDGGNDILKGMGGGDYMEGGAGNDKLFGTNGFKDHFVFRDRDGSNLGKDTLKSFKDGEDIIRFRDFDDVKSMDDLTLKQSGKNVVIHFSHGDVVVENISVQKLSVADFDFT